MTSSFLAPPTPYFWRTAEFCKWEQTLLTSRLVSQEVEVVQVASVGASAPPLELMRIVDRLSSCLHFPHVLALVHNGCLSSLLTLRLMAGH